MTVRLLSSADDHNLAARLRICYLQGRSSNEVSIDGYVRLYSKRQSVDERSNKMDLLGAGECVGRIRRSDSHTAWYACRSFTSLR
ncbi:hypothetical protein PCAR4_280096 [Paraburkholderia caribensis]|nr:hypothetical protein PCAR4_280096 [Paraburkholderia caribensis]